MSVKPYISGSAARIASISIFSGLFLLLAILARQPAAAELNEVEAIDSHWSPPLLLAGGAYGPIMRVAPNGTIMLAYGQATSGTNNQINPTYRVLPAGETSWSAPAPIHSSSADFSQVTFQFNSASVAHAVWRSDTAVYYAPQTTWASNQFEIVFNNNPKLVADPKIAIGSDNVRHVVAALQDDTPTAPYNIHHAYLSGGSWVTTQLSVNTRQSSGPEVAVDDNGNVHVIWEERFPDLGPDPDPEDPFIYQIFHRIGVKTGDNYTWNTAVVISGSQEKAQQPAILAQGNELHVTFTNLVSTSEQYVYYVRRPAGSTTWTTPVNITGNTPLAVNTNAPFFLVSRMTLCQGNLHAFYHGSPVLDTNEQVYGQERKNGVWQNREPVTGSDARRVRPSAVCRDDSLNLVYEQLVNPNVNHQIYYVFSREQIFLPAIHVVKTANVDSAGVGQVITYTYTVMNVGDVTLTGVTAVDTPLGPVPLLTDTLASLATTTGVLTYTVTEADLPGPLTNNVLAGGLPPVGEMVTGLKLAKLSPSAR